MNLLSHFQQQTISHPDAIAMRENQRELSYQSLALKVGAVRQAIINAGITPQNRIALEMDRGLDAACSLLGILAAGCCYVPLDIKSPLTRRKFIIKDAALAAVIGIGNCPNEYPPIKWFNYQAITEQELQLSTIDCENLAAILYTSGSTGTPKGVALSHRAILAFSSWAAQLLQLDQNDHIASLTPFYFDLSTFDLFACLAVGASINFVPQQLPMAPSQLSSWLNQHAITGFYTVPSVLGFLTLKGNLKQTPLPKLRFLLFAGEVFATPLLNTLTRYLPDTRFYNFYGPTETNVCSYWQVNPKHLHNQTAIPIGRPACGNQLKIAEKTGELVVKGPTLMSGYWSAGALQPSLSVHDWYATGDKVSLNENGEYCYHGRLDRMLKCSGFRVEPAEIEQTLQSIPGVIDCAVVGINDETAGQRPAAALVIDPGSTIQQLRQMLIQRLPGYMIPSRWQIVSALPLLANGKIDYTAITTLFVTSE